MGFETVFLYLFYLFIILISLILTSILVIFFWIKLFFYRKTKVIGDRLKVRKI